MWSGHHATYVSVFPWFFCHFLVAAEVTISWAERVLVFKGRYYAHIHTLKIDPKQVFGLVTTIY